MARKKVFASKRKSGHDSEDDSNKRDLRFIGTNDANDSNEEDDDVEANEIFNLDLQNSDDEDEDGEDQDDEDSDEDSFDEDEDEDENGIRALVDNLAPELRQRVLVGGVNNDSDEEEEEEEEEDEPQHESWGKKKTYWTGDTADLEIGQDVADAEDEEVAAKELLKKKLSRMSESDFFDDFASQPTASGRAGSKKSSSKKTLSLTGNLENLIDQQGVEVEALTRDVSHLTPQQKADIVAAESPELLGLLEDIKDKVAELETKLTPLRQLVTELVKIEGQQLVSDDLVSYLEVKQQLLMSYCVNVSFYLYMKSLGKSVRSHPVMRHLLELRYAMEKLKPLDGKLKYQIDRLLKLSTLDINSDEVRTAALRPNPSAMLLAEEDEDEMESEDGDDAAEDEEEEEEDLSEEDVKAKGVSKAKKSGKKKAQDSDEGDDSEIEDDLGAVGHATRDKQIYKAPRMVAMHYDEKEREEDRRSEQVNRRRKKLKNSEILETLQEEFGSAPEAVSSTGVTGASKDQREVMEAAEERRQFEEERFVRLTVSRKDKKAMKRVERESGRLDNLADIGDVGEFEDLAELTRGLSESHGRSNEVATSQQLKAKSGGGLKSNDALQLAVQAFVQSSSGGGDTKGGSKRDKSRPVNDDVLAPLQDTASARAAASAKKSKKQQQQQLAVDEYGNDMAGGSGEDDGGFGGEEVTERKRRRAPTSAQDFDDGEENLLESFSKKKKDFLKKKQEHYSAEPQYGGYEESVDEGNKRGITYEILKNKGLMPHRAAINRNPRVKKRKAYEKAVVARKGQVREVQTQLAAGYGGEQTGIKSNISRSRKIN